MKCVSSVTYSVLINDKAYGMIIPERGLRQGDPLSPFLFVLCTEGLTHLLNKAQKDDKISGIQFSEEGPVIHHMLFADDSLFLCKADRVQALKLQSILYAYGAATGQTINVDKSSITFGKKVPITIKKDIQSILGITSEGGAGTYLGLPECFSGSKIEMLSYIKDRVKNKLSGWFSRTLSQGDFWWSSSEHTRKIHWQSWEKLCLPKHQGGMGFRDVGLFNQALLAKQAWRIYQYPNCLFSRLMKSRYFPRDQFLSGFLGNRPSFGWRSILHGRDLLNQGLVKRVGNGASIRVWIDQWLDDDGLRAPWIKNHLIDINLKVSGLIDFERRDWNNRKLDDLFFPADILKIKANKPIVAMEDFMVWKHNKSGDFSVKSAYWLASQIAKKSLIREVSALPSVNGLKEQVWKLQTEPKIKVFMWKILSGALPVADLLIRRGIRMDDRCEVCGMEDESIDHVLFSCPLSRQIWALSNYPAPDVGFNHGSVFSHIHHFLVNRDNLTWPRELRKSFPWILWRIWKNRNLLVFEGKSFSPLETAEKIRSDVEDWFAAQILDSISEERHEAESMPRQQERNIVVDDAWIPPREGWLKCNIGSAWSKRNSLGGCAWVLRDERGEVLLHSRRAFTYMKSRKEVILISIVWAVESIFSHNLRKVIFAVEDMDLVRSVNRPKAWPSFRYQSTIILAALNLMVDWILVGERRTANRGAFLIAKSVIDDCRLQSYVAKGFPFWLSGLFCNERVPSSR